MKRWINALLALAVVMAMSPAGRAANEPYVFEEWDMEVTVPEGDYYILLRDMDPESQTLADVGLTAEQVNEILVTGNIYLDALYYDASYELAVTVLTGETYETVFDYALLSKLQRDATAAESKRELERQGYTVKGDISWHDGEEAVFGVIELVPPESNSWSYQYQTVYNGKMVIASASSVYLDAPTEEIKEQVRLLAEGIHFTKKLPVPQEVLDTYQEDEKGPSSILMSALRGAVIGALVAGGGYKVLEFLKKKKKAASDGENEGDRRDDV